MLPGAPGDEMCTLGHFYRRLCDRYSDRVAIKMPDRTLTYAALEDRAAKLASAFQSMGLGTGDRIAILMQNRPEFIITEIAASRAGIIIFPLNHKLSDDDIEYTIEDASIHTIVVGPRFFDTAVELRQKGTTLEHIIGVDREQETPIGFHDYSELVRKAEPTPPASHVDPTSPAFIYYTGGTTGDQKGTVHSHSAIVLNIYAHIHELEVNRGEEMVLLTPLAHSASLFYKTGLVQGATIYLRQGFNPEEFRSLLKHERISWTYIIPTMISSLITSSGEDTDAAPLNTIVYGSAPIPPAQLQRGIDLFGDVFVQFYGLVEIPNLVAVLPREYHDPGEQEWLRSAGVATQLADIKILDPNHERLGDGDDVGEIAVRAPYQMSRYLNNSHRDEDDWIRTGDLGRVDDRGRLFILDRIQDVIVTDDKVIYSCEVENVIQRHPNVEQVAVIGTPAIDDYLPDITPANRLRIEQNIKAVVVVNDSQQITLDEIQHHCREHLPDYKIPSSVDTVGQLPETAYGKTDKKSLRDPYW